MDAISYEYMQYRPDLIAYGGQIEHCIKTLSNERNTPTQQFVIKTYRLHYPAKGK